MTNMSCSAFLTADHAWTENNGKIGLVGIFDNFTLASYPAQIPQFSIYFRIENVGIGKHSVVINWIQESTHSVINSLTAELEVIKDTPIFQLHVIIPSVIIPKDDDYSFHLSVDGNQLAKHIIHAVLIKE
jgi:hypothetical protein